MKTHRIHLLALAAVIAPLTQHAQEGASRFKAARRSEFSASGISRNPFWPIGYQKQEKAQESQKAPASIVLDLPDGAVKVSSILMGDPALAVLNDREYAVGDTLSVKVSGTNAKFVVTAIGDGYVRLSNGGRFFVVKQQYKQKAPTAPAASAPN